MSFSTVSSPFLFGDSVIRFLVATFLVEAL